MDLYIHITDKRKEETAAQFAKYRLYNGSILFDVGELRQHLFLSPIVKLS